MTDFDITMKYAELKKKADNAEAMYQQTQSAMDWEWFMACEADVSMFAYENEDKIDWTSV